MKSGLKPAVALLVILGLGDLVPVPFVLAAHRQHAGEPPRGTRPPRRQARGDSPPRR